MSVRRVFLVVVPALAIALRAPGAPPAPAGELVGYTLSETFRSATPRGEIAGGAEGRVTVLAGRAIWQLESGRFPRSAASAVLAEAGTVTLMDRAEKIYSEAPWAEFDRLFRDPSAPDSGLSAAAVRDLTVSLRPAGAGAAFDGRPSARHTLELKYALVVSTPGRSATITHEVRAAIATVSGLDAARSPLDDLSRLFRLRGAAREAVEAELSHLEGWPVSVRIESAAVWTSEPVGGAKDPSATQPLPVKSSATVTREVSALVRRSATAADAGLLRIPEEFRSRPFERMVRAAPGLER